MEFPVVSVVVPTYNRGHVLSQTLDSVLSQTYPNREVIVIDDGSTDGTEKAMEPYQDRVIYVRQPNQGLAAARNAGLTRSTGELVAWLDSDDIWTPEKLAVQVAVMQEHPDCVLVASDFSAFDDNGYFDRSHLRSYYAAVDRTPGGLAGLFPGQEFFRTTGRPYVGPDVPETVVVYHGDIYSKLIGGNVLHPPTVMFRRDAALRAGMLDAAFRRDTDYEYFLRLSRQGSTAFVDCPLMRYRYTEDQMSSDKYLADIAESRVLVLNSLQKRDPALANDPAFKRRLGYSHLAVANALAEAKRRQAARHLLHSISLGYLDSATARTTAKLLLPRPLVGLARKLRGSSSGG